MKSRAKRGFAIAQALLAGALLLYAAYAIFNVYATSARFEEQSQHRALAAVIAESLMDDAIGHTFGAPAPARWGFSDTGLQGAWQSVTPDVWVQGRRVESTIHVQWNLQTGSLIGRGDADYDIVTFVLSWRDAVGRNPDYGPYRGVFYPSDNVHLVVQTPVWR